MIVGGIRKSLVSTSTKKREEPTEKEKAREVMLLENDKSHRRDEISFSEWQKRRQKIYDEFQ